MLFIFTLSNYTLMKNKNIIHARQKAEIYKAYYRPSINPLRFLKSVLGVLIFGSGTAANSFDSRKRGL